MKFLAMTARSAWAAMALLLLTMCVAARPAAAQAMFDWTWDFEQPPSQTADEGISGWFPTGGAGFDTGKGLALNGTGNAWVRASDGWNAMSRLLDLSEVYNGYACTFSVWVRTSDTLEAGYVAVRNGANPSGDGEVLSIIELFGARVSEFWRRPSPIVGNPIQNEYELISVRFTPPASRKVLILVGLRGTGKDAWMQIDDAAVRCRRLPL